MIWISLFLQLCVHFPLILKQISLLRYKQCTLTLVISERNKDSSYASRASAQDYEKEKCLQIWLIPKPVGELPGFLSPSSPLIYSHLKHLTLNCSLCNLRGPGSNPNCGPKKKKKKKNYRDLKTSLLGLSVLAFIITGPQQGGEKGESGDLELDAYENRLGNEKQIQL